MRLSVDGTGIDRVGAPDMATLYQGLALGQSIGTVDESHIDRSSEPWGEPWRFWVMVDALKTSLSPLAPCILTTQGK